MYPNSVKNLVDCFKDLPGIGEKTAERLTFSLMNFDKERLTSFADAIIDLRDKIINCRICGNISENDVCEICGDESRNKNVICVLEDFKSVFAFEKSGNYDGTYHVLNGLISPIDGVGPEDINISSLIKRIENLENCELILALKSSVEGEATTMFISKIFQDKNVSISRLPYGIPMGAEIDYLDPISLDKAMSDRKIISRN